MKKTRNRVNLVIAYPFTHKYFLVAVLLVFIASTSATVTVGYGLEKRNKTEYAPHFAAEDGTKIAAAPTSLPTTKPTRRPVSKPSPNPTVEPSPTPTIVPSSTPGNRDPESTNNNSSTPPATSQPTPTPTPTPTTGPNPTPTPGPHEPNPPVMEITYPAEGVTIILSGGERQVCLREEVRGGNSDGLQRKYNYNNSGWTEYSNMSQLCLDPQPLINVIKTQYRNGNGDESPEYTRTFVVVL